jgi:hypothetical protein
MLCICVLLSVCHKNFKQGTQAPYLSAYSTLLLLQAYSRLLFLRSQQAQHLPGHDLSEG